MNKLLPRRSILASLAGLCALGVISLVGCGTAPVASVPKPDAAVVQTLAPTGTLRIGVYNGSPTSLVKDPSGKPAGVAHDMGQLMAGRLGVPAQVVVFDRVAQVLEALKAGQIDVTFTNASPARLREFAFTQPLLSLELGYIVPANGKVQTIDAVDQMGVRIGVSQGSSSQAALGVAFKAAKLVSFTSLDLAKSALLKSEIDGFATNKGILNEVQDDLNKSGQFKILAGRWGMEHMGLAVPKERASAAAFVQTFGDELKTSGDLAKIAARAGLRGLVEGN
jgi:polar amino acid transport system substrate-binding protein